MSADPFSAGHATTEHRPPPPQLTSTTLCPGWIAPTCIWILSVLYSVMYSSEIVSPEQGQGGLSVRGFDL